MQYESMGKLIQAMRREKGLTQKQLAEMLNITDKAVSKWERDIAYPDTATLPMLADILGVSVEALLTAKNKTVPANNQPSIDDDANPYREYYKERTRELLLQGLPGFIVGSLLIIVLFSIVIIPNLGSYTIGEIIGGIVSIIFMITFVGIMFAGFPYGWKIITNFLGQWTIFGHILVIIALLLLKFCFAFLIGAIAYPIALIYNIIRSQKTKRRVRIWAIVVITVTILWFSFIGIYSAIDAKTTNVNPNTDAADYPTVQYASFDSLNNDPATINTICHDALDATLANEDESVNEYGWRISESSQIHGIYFFDAKDTENPPYIISKDIYLSNAVMVVSGYYVAEGSGISINQWEMDVTIFPNFTLDENNSLIYDSDNVYSHSLRADDMEYLMDWLSGEYPGMNITEITNSKFSK